MRHALALIAASTLIVGCAGQPDEPDPAAFIEYASESAERHAFTDDEALALGERVCDEIRSMRFPEYRMTWLLQVPVTSGPIFGVTDSPPREAGFLRDQSNMWMAHAYLCPEVAIEE